MPCPRGTAEWPEAQGTAGERRRARSEPKQTALGPHPSLGLHWPLTSLQDENWEPCLEHSGHGQMRLGLLLPRHTLSTGDQPATNGA